MARGASVTSLVASGAASLRGVSCGLPGLAVCVGSGVLTRASGVVVLFVRNVAVAEGALVPSDSAGLSGTSVSVDNGPVAAAIPVGVGVIVSVGVSVGVGVRVGVDVDS
jgi:hypothetical protein